MTTSEALSRMKMKFGINSAEARFDTMLTEALEAGVDRISPYAAEYTSGSQAITHSDYSYNNAAFATHKVEAIDFTPDSTSIPQLWTSYMQRGATLYFTERFSESGTINYYYRTPYSYDNFSDIPTSVVLPLLDFASSEFASMLAGNHTMYNIYQQASGARGVDNMLQMSDFYEGRALGRAREIADAEGIL